MSSSYLTWLRTRRVEGREPGRALPDEIETLLDRGITSRVSGLSYNTPWKINRTYDGMSNWGFGIYFGSDLEWARRYGDCISVVRIDPSAILSISHTDFAGEVEGTLGGLLRKKLTAAAPDRRMAEEAAVMYRVVKSIKKTAKALYVDVGEGRGQICVFQPSAISPVCYFEVAKDNDIVSEDTSSRRKLTKQECEDIKDSYFSKDSRETLSTLSRLYRVSTSTILKVANGTYKPSDE